MLESKIFVFQIEKKEEASYDNLEVRELNIYEKQMMERRGREFSLFVISLLCQCYVTILLLVVVVCFLLNHR